MYIRTVYTRIYICIICRNNIDQIRWISLRKITKKKTAHQDLAEILILILVSIDSDWCTVDFVSSSSSQKVHFYCVPLLAKPFKLQPPIPLSPWPVPKQPRFHKPNGCLTEGLISSMCGPSSRMCALAWMDVDWLILLAQQTFRLIALTSVRVL